MDKETDGKQIKSSNTADPELDDLLDSALEDFEKTKVPAKVDKSDASTDEANWDNEFLSQAKLFDEQMAALLQGAGVQNIPSSGDITQGLSRMAEAAAAVVDGKGLEQVEPQVIDSITQALKGLKEGSENLQSMMDPDEMANMFNGLDMGDGGGAGDSNPFMPFVQGMMQSLLSAEVLLPSLKELHEKYPSWLEENKDKITADEKQRYMKQQDLFKVVIGELEQEKSDDSAQVKNDRFKKVLENMQKLHEYGQPPAELVGGEAGTTIPPLPGTGDPSQCSLM